MHTSLGVLFAGTVIWIYMQCTCVNSYSLSGTVNSSLVNVTEDCLCNPTGSLSPHCNNETASCVCKPGYQGPNCTDCQNGHYHHSNRSTECVECECDHRGSLDSQCDSNGTCQCKPGVGGTVCDMCLTGYYGMSVNGCQPCQYQETVTKCLRTSKKVDLKDASMCLRCLSNASWITQSSEVTCHTNEFLAPNGSCVLCGCSLDSSLDKANGSRLCDLMTGKCTECQGKACSEGGESFNYEPYIIAGAIIAGITFVVLSILLAVYCCRRCRNKSRRTPLPLWTIELRRDEDAENHIGDDSGVIIQDQAFSDIDVMYLDDSYLMESSDYFTESTDSLNRTGYHTLS
ncbi:laminin subunit beta-1-like isoform X1 [Asterias rubens]|uniref:laminin subunit beta-1-like isoform X1 n=1 Tax=Asterias rubens TaxID=7604 RepID=UPI00145518ED|nr:laminin subunit beta-1-like isoform X1 [Asterias rubens]